MYSADACTFQPGTCSLQALSRCAIVLICAAAMFATVGCAGTERLTAVPANEKVRALPLGLANARFFPATQADSLFAEADWQDLVDEASAVRQKYQPTLVGLVANPTLSEPACGANCLGSLFRSNS